MQEHVWKGKHCTLRQRNISIGRLYHANPIKGKRFFVRMLLTVKLMPKSQEYLRTMNRDENPTFQAACYTC
jgi:hypothetical protein